MFPELHRLTIFCFLCSVEQLEWYNDTSLHTYKGKKCRDANHLRQLKQWARCLDLIEAYERRFFDKHNSARHHANTTAGRRALTQVAPHQRGAHSKRLTKLGKLELVAKQNRLFDTIIKIRPDDYWFGPMVPHCVLKSVSALGPGRTAYISRQKARWSDQFFILPRQMAQTFFRPLDSGGGAAGECHGATSGLVISDRRIVDPEHFERQVFELLKLHAAGSGAMVTPMLLPRMLSAKHCKPVCRKSGKHGKDSDEEKCDRFMWYIPQSYCLTAMYGKSLQLHPG